MSEISQAYLVSDCVWLLTELVQGVICRAIDFPGLLCILLQRDYRQILAKV